MVETIKPTFCRSFPRIAVIGLGMAGACMVRALAVAATRAAQSEPNAPSLQITAFESMDQPATGASGNPVGIVHPFISKDWNLASQFMQAGVETTLRWVEELGGTSWAGITGVLQLAEDEEEALAWQGLPNRLKVQDGSNTQPSECQLEWLDTHQIRTRLGLVDTPIGGLWSVQGGWIKPSELVQACLSQARNLLGDQLSIALNHPVGPEDLSQLQQDFDAIVVCTAHDDLLPWAGLRINKIAGQVSWVQLKNSNDASEPAGLHTEPVQSALGFWPKAVVCRSGYLSPVIDGQMLVGATFERDPSANQDQGLQPTMQGHAENLQRVAEISASLANTLTPHWNDGHLKGRVAIRHASHDRMPHVGRVVSQEALNEGLPRSASQLHHLPREHKLFVLGGLGSRGLSIAPLAAEVLASQILTQESPPTAHPSHALPRPLLDAVDPARFILRAHRRAG
jgi:tRNA 5-methylaminomethyl-2-thiouridine biosynthesis bifunctional protein